MKIVSKSDLERLINNKIEENLELEYKSSESIGKSFGKKKEISKDVSAFANSNGGILIYGIKEFDEKDKRHLPQQIDPIDRTKYSKEWLEQVINSNISPRITGIKITSISLNETNEVVYVVNIPKSNTAHQASDLKYYKRFNFENVPMYDYEIRDIMNRKKHPIIDLIFKIEKEICEIETPSIDIINILNFNNVKPTKELITFNTLYVYGINVGAIYANYINCYIKIPVSILDETEFEYKDTILIDNIKYVNFYIDNTIREIKKANHYGSFSANEYWPSRYEPILPNTTLRMEKIKLKPDIEIKNKKIYWEIYADNSSKRTGTINLSEIDVYEK